MAEMSKDALTSKAHIDGEDVWVLRDYFDHSTRVSDFGGGMTVPKYKRTFSDFSSAIASAGLLVRQILEPQPTIGAQESHPQQYATALRLPQLLVMELVVAP